MDKTACLVLAADFLAIGALPRVFFRRDGILNLRWWITAWPFFACPAFILAAALGRIPVPLGPAALQPAVQPLVAATLHLASLALLFYTLGTHRIPIALWHQSNDAPLEIVTWGAYGRIRHPFYASFLLAFAGAAVLFPHPVVLALGLYMAFVLNHTAAAEERRLTASLLGDQYAAYKARTGRFFPRLGTS